MIKAILMPMLISSMIFTSVQAASQPEQMAAEEFAQPITVTTVENELVSETEIAAEAAEAVGTDFYLGVYDITFYCPCKRCCGKTDGITATGTKATEGRTIGVDPKVIPYGSQVYIEGMGWYVAEDTGGGIRNNHIDIFMSSHDRALNAGRVHRGVWLRR